MKNRCNSCGAPVNENFAKCPYCGMKYEQIIITNKKNEKILKIFSFYAELFFCYAITLTQNLAFKLDKSLIALGERDTSGQIASLDCFKNKSSLQNPLFSLNILFMSSTFLIKTLRTVATANSVSRSSPTFVASW